MKRFSKEAKLEIVKQVVSGELMPTDAIAKYEIKSMRTLVHWVKEFHIVARKLVNEEQEQLTQQMEMQRKSKEILEWEATNPLVQNSQLMWERIQYLENQNRTLVEDYSSLKNQITLLQRQFQGLEIED